MKQTFPSHSPPFHLLPLHPLLSFPFPSIPSNSLSLEVRPLKSSYMCEGALYAPPEGCWAKPQLSSNWVHFSLNMWHLVANNFSYFPDNQLTKLRVFIGWPRIFISPPKISTKHLRLVPPPHRMYAPGRHNGHSIRTNEQINKETKRQTVVYLSPFVS